MKLTSLEKRVLYDGLTIVVVVAVIMWLTILLPLIGIMGLLIHLFALLVGVGLTSVSIMDLVLASKNKPFPSWRSLNKNRKGIVWVWAVAAITIGFTALVWWVVSFPLFLYMDTIEDAYTFPAESQGLIRLVRNVLTWFLAFEVFGVLIWALVSSFRREAQQFPL